MRAGLELLASSKALLLLHGEEDVTGAVYLCEVKMQEKPAAMEVL